MFLNFSHGDIFDQTKHPPGTEIKAITYSNMQIHETEERADLYVIVDI
jgi:SHS2 domain-containing protein